MHIDKKMENLKQEKDCVSAAKNHEELKACKDKFKKEKKDEQKKDQGTNAGKPAPAV